MENLKTLLGDSFKEELSLEDVNAFLEGKKLVDLNSGNYVAKDKYQKVVDKNTEYSNLLKEFNDIKPKYDEYVQKEKVERLNNLAKSVNIKEEFIEFALSKVNGVEDVETALKEFAKNNPQFTNVVKKVNSNPDLQKGSATENKNQTMNDLIRRGAGR